MNFLSTGSAIKKRIILSVVVLAAIASMAVYYFLSYSEPASQNIASSELVQILGARSSITFPSSLSLSSINMELAPDYIKSLVSTEAEGTKYAKIIFSDNKQGFSTSYIINKSMINAYMDFVGGAYSGWSRVFAARNDDAGVIDFDNDYQIARVIMEADNSRTKVTVITINK